MTDCVDHDDLDSLIKACRDAKAGDKDFVLTTGDPHGWIAAIGSESKVIHISEALMYGEVDAEAKGESPIAAVRALYQKLTKAEAVGS